MPPSKLKPARILKDALEDLDDIQLEEFRRTITDRPEEPRIKYNALRGKDPYEIAKLMVSVFTEAEAINVASEVLRDINCNEEARNLDKKRDEMLSSSESCYGDMMKIKTKGASLETANQDKLGFAGVQASQALARNDLPALQKYTSTIKDVGKEKDVDPALIAAIISRACRGGTTLKDGWGKYDSDSFGLMQINVNPNGGGHTVLGQWDSEEHIGQGVDILISFIQRMRVKFPNWTKEEQLRGGVAAYCAGDGNIHSLDNVDGLTPCGDFSSDVIARAQWLKRNGF